MLGMKKVFKPEFLNLVCQQRRYHNDSRSKKTRPFAKIKLKLSYGYQRVE